MGGAAESLSARPGTAGQFLLSAYSPIRVYILESRSYPSQASWFYQGGDTAWVSLGDGMRWE